MSVQAQPVQGTVQNVPTPAPQLWQQPQNPAERTQVLIMNVVGFVFVVLAIVASVVAFGLSEEEIYDWAAGIYGVSAVMFSLAGFFFYLAMRARSPGSR